MKDFPHTIEELCEQVYTGSLIGLLQKADHPVYTSTAAAWRALYGKKVWAQLNYEPNIFACLPKDSWDQTGWRVETVLPASVPSGGVAEVDGTPEISKIPDTLKPTWLEVEAKPKVIWHGFDVSEMMAFLSKVDDAVDVLPELRERFGLYHALAINAMLATGVEDVAGVNFESIDRMTASNLTRTTCAGITDGEIDVYGINRHGGASWADGHSSCAAANRTLTLALIDTVLKDCWAAGGKPKVIITGYDTLLRWQQLLQAQRRFMDAATVMPSFGGVKGAAPGVEGGFMVATYFGIPIIPSQSVKVDGISRIYFLDTDYLRLRIALPTEYFESDDMLAIDKIGVQGGYRTMGELICKGFFASGQLRDLS
jgi:hypothetical protein